MIKILLLYAGSAVAIWASALMQHYPDYRYVFSEFDIDPAYIENKDFESYAYSHEKALSRFYRKALQEGAPFLSMIRGELMEEGLSDLFLYLSIIESGLSAEAVSSKKAVGLWQFMPKTARAYDLEVCAGLDQRCDPRISTRAAIRYLLRLHQRFGKWYLAVLAYNCGEGRLARAIAKAHSDLPEVLLDPQARYLPAETRDYLKKILLVAMIGEQEDIDFPLSEEGYVEVEVPKGAKIAHIADAIGVPRARLLKMNPQFKQGRIPQKDAAYTLRIPEESLAAYFLKYEAKHEREQRPERTFVKTSHLLSHTVVLGETLSSIAQKYHSSSEAIKRLNRLPDDSLEVGALLVIPVTQEAFDSYLSE